jgi:hypothetical protein
MNRFSMSTLRVVPATPRRCDDLIYGEHGASSRRYRPVAPFYVDGILYDIDDAECDSWNVQLMIELRHLGSEDWMSPAVACLNCPLSDVELDAWVHERWSDDDGPGCECREAA